MLTEEHREGKRPVKEDAGLVQTVLLQKLAEVIANRLPKRNGVPCPTDGLRPLGRRRHECKNSGRVAGAFDILHDILAAVALDIQAKNDVRPVLPTLNYFQAELVGIRCRNVRPPGVF